MKKIFCFIIILSVLMISINSYTERLEFNNKQSHEFADSQLYEKLYVDYIDESEIDDNISLMTVTNSSIDDIYSYIYNILKQHNKFYYSEDENLMKIPLYSSGYRLKDDDMMEVIYKFLNECGELFLTKAYAVDLYDKKISGETYVYNIYFRYFVPIDSIDNELERIEDIVKPFVDSIDPELGELEKVLLVHDYISSVTRYYQNGDEFDKQHLHSMYGIFVNGVAVCQGYTEAMCYLLDKLGIECVSCLCNDINHVWNCVRIDGKWYHVDLTWDDVYQSDDKILLDGVSYDNFLTSFDTVLTLKEGHKTYTMNDQYVFDEQGNHVLFTYENGDFIYPLSSVTDKNSNNKEYEKGYIFNGVDVVFFKISDTQYEKIIGKGFDYVNGKWVLKTESDGIHFAKEHIFEFDSLKAMDYAVSKPVKMPDGYYRFLRISQNKSNIKSVMNMFVKGVSQNEKVDILQKSANPVMMVGPYAYYGVKDAEFSTQLDNFVSSDFFIWDIELLHPMSYKIIK